MCPVADRRCGDGVLGDRGQALSSAEAAAVAVCGCGDLRHAPQASTMPK
jgi:hypothetical protein